MVNLISFFVEFENSIVHFIQHQTLLGAVLLLVFEEAGAPTPISGGMVVAFAGYSFTLGKMPPYPLVFISLLVSMLVGSTMLYYSSFHMGSKLVLRFGKLLHLNEEKLLFLEEKFKQYGPWLIIFGRHLPGFRIPITIFSGISRVKYSTFIICTFISILFWIPLYLFIGMQLGEKTVVILKSHSIFLVLTPIIIIVGSIYGTLLISRRIDLHLRKRKNKK